MLGAKQVAVPNRLLAALPRKDYRNLLPVLEPVKLAFEEVLYEPHARIRHVYFPNDCLVSMLTTVDTGRAAEVGLIGYRRGTITILDHRGLVAAACGCYKTVKDIYTQAQA